MPPVVTRDRRARRARGTVAYAGHGGTGAHACGPPLSRRPSRQGAGRNCAAVRADDAPVRAVVAPVRAVEGRSAPRARGRTQRSRGRAQREKAGTEAGRGASRPGRKAHARLPARTAARGEWDGGVPPAH
ncbi:hypothetical protein DTL70_27970 [Streptomyces diacarni]|uniref:Uncharacterized protein n=1 Tax=Streptomyces diacarni TaxID=2800381 RepID=A0A367EFP8_9ACTN|nr:hypothetical protein DTL70_27970 [Streptomyces diacarni]